MVETQDSIEPLCPRTGGIATADVQQVRPGNHPIKNYYTRVGFEPSLAGMALEMKLMLQGSRDWRLNFGNRAQGALCELMRCRVGTTLP